MKLACLGLLFLAGFTAGCAAENADPLANESDELGTGLLVKNPAGTYTARLTLLGSGCPNGTWDGEISPDGKHLTLELSGFLMSINPGQGVAVKDCVVLADLSRRGLGAFVLRSTQRRAIVAFDQPGMTGTWTMASYFTGQSAPPPDRATITGPADFGVIHGSEGADPKHPRESACTTSTRLIAQTRFVLNNNPQKSGTGYLSDGIAEDASFPGMSLTFDLDTESCQ